MNGDVRPRYKVKIKREYGLIDNIQQVEDAEMNLRHRR